MITKTTLTTLAVALLVMVWHPAQAGSVSWKGCGITKKAFMKQMATHYKAKTGTEIKISGGGATKGIRASAAGTADIGGTCRRRLSDGKGGIHPQERGTNLVHVAWDALVAIVHPTNPVNNITLSNLKKIYQGEVTNWNALGGPDKRIILVTRDGKTSGVGHMFRMLVFNDAAYKFKALSLKVKSTGPLEKMVEKKSSALGIDGISSAKKRKVKFLSIEGVAPTKANISAGKYPLFRPLYLALSDKASPEAKSVVDFVLSAEGQAIISQEGTVNLAEGKALSALWAKKEATF